MRYTHIKQGRFISRENRFIAHIEIDGKIEVCHVKTTGRCRELFVPGATVWVDENMNPQRKTKYDLVTVQKGEMLVNVDSQAPNLLFEEWALGGGIKGLDMLKRECRYKGSRFDFMLMRNGMPMYLEVKGVTLEENNAAIFPDAPTERGLKHTCELMDARENGYRCALFFAVQMKGISYFTPNRLTQPAFASALAKAGRSGVEIMAYDCIVYPDSIVIDSPVEVRL
ncbi:MAG: DNA/RNA nuclease SfsA [Clostridiaceae bacterium]|nr:DNA/RNA nuclease SfsA [Clostridiaceae bacterium]